MRSKLALAAAAAALLAGCAQSPTASPTRTSAPRYDGGNTLGSGHFQPDTTSSSSSAEAGGNTLGSGA
jgi:opacity protein-like surface antigen